MSVHYKFKSAISYDTITFDGLHISVKDLKKAILHQKQIGKNTDFDLQVTNAQTNEEYNNDQTLIPKNTSLIVSRIPLTTQQKKAWERAEQNNQLVLSKQILNLDSHEPDSAKLKGADILGSNASEEDKINAMMAQSTQEYDPSNFVKIRGGNQYGEVPSNYICHRCHNPGHWIKNCPNNNTTSDPIDIKKATGIPRGFLVPVDDPSVPGAMLTGLGTFAVPSIDQEAYKQSMKPQKKQETNVEKVIIPEDLLCNLCSDLLTDAIMMPCCGTSFCDECIRNALLESEENECPDCHGKEISPETLIPNRYLRNAVNGFKDKTGYSKRIEAAKEKNTPDKSQTPVPQINVEPQKEEETISTNTQSPPSDPSTEVPKDEIYRKIAAVVKPFDKTRRNYSAIGTINNLNNTNVNNNNSHSHPNFKPQVQCQNPPVSVSNNNRPNNTNVHIPITNSFQNTRHNITKSTESRITHNISRYNSQSLSIPPHHHMRPCLPIGPADISVPPPPFPHPPPSLQPDMGYSQMQPIHNPPPPGLDRNSPVNASSDEGMHPPESTHHHLHHQMDKFDNQTTTLQPMMRTGYPTNYYPPPMSNYEPYMPMDIRIRGFHRGYTRRLTRGQQMGSNFRPDYRNGGNYINNKRTIDDPLAVFQRILRERDSKRRDMRGRHSVSRSRSRSLSRSRSREHSRSLSRSPSRIIQHRARSISRSPLPPRRSITPRRRSRTRSRSPIRKRKKSLSPIKRLPIKSRRRTRSPSRDVGGRRSRSLSLHRRTRSRSRSLTHRNRMSPSLRFRSRSPSFYSSPASRFSNYHREDDHYGSKGSNWRGRGAWNKGTQPYQQSHRHRGQLDGHYDGSVDRLTTTTTVTTNYVPFDHTHFAMDPNLVRDWDEIRDKEIREREKEKKEEEDKLKMKSKSRSPAKHHKVEKQQRQEAKPSPEKNHKDSDKKDKGKRKKKKDVDVDKKKKKKSREKKESKDDGNKKAGDEKGNEDETTVIKVVVKGDEDDGEKEPAAPGTSESPPSFESIAVIRERGEEDVRKTTADNEENVTVAMTDELYGDMDGGVASVDTTVWGGNYVKSPENAAAVAGAADPVANDKPTTTKAETQEVLAELPERSKWEMEEDMGGDKLREERDDENQNNGGLHVSVTNEVLKRAENAIFQKIVRPSVDVSTATAAGKNKFGTGTDRSSSDGAKENKKPATDVTVCSGKELKKTEKRSGTEDRKMENSTGGGGGGAKEKKDTVSKEKRLENCGKSEKKSSSMDAAASRHKKTDGGGGGRPSQDAVCKRPPVAADVSSKKTDGGKRPDKKTADRRSKDRSEAKTTSEKSSRKDVRGGSSTTTKRNSNNSKEKREPEVAGSQDASLSSSVQMTREARKTANSIQITIPTAAEDDGKEVAASTTKRISAKDRLGEKVDDKDDEKQHHYKTSSSSRSGEKRKASRSPIRVHSTLIVPEPLSRKMRATSNSRRDSSKTQQTRNPSKTERTSSAAVGPRTVSRRSGGDDDKSSRIKSETRRVQQQTAMAADKSHHSSSYRRDASSEHQKSGCSGGGSLKRGGDDRRPVTSTDRRGDERKKDNDRRGNDAVKKSSRDEPPPPPVAAAAETRERRNRRLEPDRRVVPVAVAAATARSDDDDDEPPVGGDENCKIEKNKKEQTTASTSSTSSSSSDSSPVRSKKRKKAAKKRKKKHAKKKKAQQQASSSDSDDTDSPPSSESDETGGAGGGGSKQQHKKKKKKDQQRGKHKSHKKAVKKKSKKSKHK